MADDASLIAALAVIQARGAIGERSLAEAVAHADRFVDLIPEGPHSLVDLGSGGGLPALVVAWRRADLLVTMIERRASRADLLRRAVIAMGLVGRT
ncbi:MAG: RsmG family class I SAM-dependent methyltransferase, partial [Ilumatobacteraceae bacterium]